MPEYKEFGYDFRYFEDRVGQMIKVPQGCGPSEYDLLVSMTHGNIVVFGMEIRVKPNLMVSGLKRLDDPRCFRAGKIYKIECWSEIYVKNGKLRYIDFEGKYDVKLRKGYFLVKRVVEQSQSDPSFWTFVKGDLFK